MGKTTVQRAQRWYDTKRWKIGARLERRAYNRAQEAARRLGTRYSADSYDNSFEIYGCTHEDRLTSWELQRLRAIGYGTIWLNSDRQQVTYCRRFDYEPHLSATQSDAQRKSYPDQIVIVGEERMTLGEARARGLVKD